VFSTLIVLRKSASKSASKNVAICDDDVYNIEERKWLIMTRKTTRYTATLPVDVFDELKELAKDKQVPSVNFAVNEALVIYLKEKKETQYENSMKEAGRDKAFLTRTIECAKDFSAVDGEVDGTW